MRPQSSLRRLRRLICGPRSSLMSWRAIRAADRVPLSLIARWSFPNCGADGQMRTEPVLMDGECRLRTFAGALVSELQRLERTYGAVGYREQWGRHDFPSERLAELQGLLKEGSRGI